MKRRTKVTPLTELAARDDALDDEMARSPIGRRVGKLERFFRILLLSVIFDVVLSVLLGLGGYLLNHVAHRADDSAASAQAAAEQVAAIIDGVRRNSQSINAACVRGNEDKADQIKLWRKIFEVSARSSRPMTPEEQQEDARTRREVALYLADLFAPEKCPPPHVEVP